MDLPSADLTFTLYTLTQVKFHILRIVDERLTVCITVMGAAKRYTSALKDHDFYLIAQTPTLRGAAKELAASCPALFHGIDEKTLRRWQKEKKREDDTGKV